MISPADLMANRFFFGTGKALVQFFFFNLFCLTSFIFHRRK